MGCDVSPSSIAVAGIGWDSTLRKLIGPATTIHRWEKDVDYFTRLKDAAHAPNYIFDVIAELRMTPNLEDIFIAVEEPWPLGIVSRSKKNQSGWLKQQAQISGAFLGGLIRYGYMNLEEINSHHWRTVVANELGITTYYKKWDEDGQGKFRAKQWAMQHFDGRIPDWPDIINHSKRGNIPRPEGSHARAAQCDDRYVALAIMEFHRREIKQFRST